MKPLYFMETGRSACLPSLELRREVTSYVKRNNVKALYAFMHMQDNVSNTTITPEQLHSMKKNSLLQHIPLQHIKIM